MQTESKNFVKKTEQLLMLFYFLVLEFKQNKLKSKRKLFKPLLILT